MSDETQDRVAEIRARWAATTPGPWRTRPNVGTSDPMCRGDVGIMLDAPFRPDVLPMIGEVWAERERGRPNPEQARRDAEAIASAPTDVAWLVERVATLEATRQWALAALRADRPGEAFDYLERADAMTVPAEVSRV